MDLIATPERVVHTNAGSKPSGIRWEALGDRAAEMPLLDRLRPD
jgi:hypothetical protein